MSANLKILLTGDGSPTLFNPELQEPYHSTVGALRECEHVYVAAGLNHTQKVFSHAPLKILEIGFGLGLNTLATLSSLSPDDEIDFLSYEQFPLSPTLIDELLTTSSIPHSESYQKILTAPWNQKVKIQENFLLTKLNDDFIHAAFTENEFHLVYFDAFAPDKTPEMWSEFVLQKTYAALQPKGVWVTYAAKGEIKRRLKKIGFTVETLPGFARKREMIRAIK